MAQKPQITRTSPATRLAWALAVLYVLDRLLRLLALRRFFRRPPPPPPRQWPSATLICPLTRTPNDLRGTLEARARLDYPGPLHCLLVCDDADQPTLSLCRELLAAYRTWNATIITVAPDSGTIASKLAKLNAALPHAEGDLLCFVDDDVLLPPHSLHLLARHALAPGAGAVFGLACYTAWGTLAEQLMSGFVNSSALPSYVPLDVLVEPFTVTGHCFAILRGRFVAAGGFADMAGRSDDDHELARRTRRLGLRNVQTPLIYGVENRLASLGEYHNQLRRWMLMPRRWMLPTLTRRERAALALCSLGPLLPPATALLALLARRPPSFAATLCCLGSFLTTQAIIERAYLPYPMPATGWVLAPALALLTPLHVALAAVGGDTIVWRGRRLRVEPGGYATVLSEQE